MPERSITERLQDPEEVFSAQDIHAAFEAIAPKLGYSRPSDAQKPRHDIATTSLVIEGRRRLPSGEWEKNEDGSDRVLRSYEHLSPVVIVRARTVRDTRITIPSIVDKVLGTNLNPSPRTIANATAIAVAMAVIVSPADLCDRVLDSPDDRDLLFFEDFYACYDEWLKVVSDEISGKKSGMAERSHGKE